MAWAFEWSPALVNAGAVENHRGSLETPASEMGFWTAFLAEPAQRMESLQYDDLKIVEAQDADPLTAYRVVRWIGHQPFRALHRNCLDDAYDVLRAFGVQGLEPPALALAPREWFGRLDGRLAHVGDFRWHDGAHPPGNGAPPGDVQPLQPTWRRPWHPDFHLLNFHRLRLALPHK